MRRRLQVLVGIAAMACSVAVGTATASAAGTTYTVRFGSPQPVTGVDTQALETWAADVKRDTKGQVAIKIYPDDELGADATELTAVVRGTQQGFAGTTADFEGYNKAFDVLDLPYMFPGGTSQAAAVLFGSADTTFTHDLTHNGLQLIGWLGEGSRDLISKSAISTPSQLKGVKVRVEEAAIPEGMYKWVGADTNPIAYTDVYTALETGVVSALDEPVDDLYTEKFYQQVCCLTKTADVFTVNPMVINASYWKTIPPNDQAIIIEDATKIMKKEFGAEDRAASVDIGKMEKAGLKVVPSNLKAWVKVWTKFDDSEVKKLPKSVQSLYGIIRTEEQRG